MPGAPGYTYDAENRISKVGAGSTATFTYDAEGRRASKNAYTYLYDLAGHAVAELNSGTWDRGEVYAAGRHLATAAAHGQLPAPWSVALKIPRCASKENGMLVTVDGQPVRRCGRNSTLKVGQSGGAAVNIRL
jgi:YD repeat-containing protein